MNKIPNPMVPEAILALNMVVPVVVGYFDGMWSGAIVGLVGTTLNFLVKIPLTGADYYEAVAIIPHAMMGLAAGFVARKRSRIGTAMTILVGHGLNVLVFFVVGLLPFASALNDIFWTGLLAEAMVDLILIVFVISVIQRVQTPQRQLTIQRIGQRSFLLRSGGVALLAILLALLFMIQAKLAAFLFIIPVVLAAVELGVLEAWLTALLLSAVLGWAAVLKGLTAASAEVSLILVLNLVALSVGELAGSVRRQQLLAQQREERLTVVNRIARAASSTLDLRDLLEVLRRELTVTFDPDAFFIAWWDQEAQELDFCLQVDRGVETPPERRPLGASLTGIIITTGQPVLIRNMALERDWLAKVERWGTMEIPLSWLGAPMRIGDQVIGVISVQVYEPYAYGREERQLLSTIAEQVGVAVENARLYQEVQRQAAELSLAVDRLQELDRLKSEFIQNVSHELRSPLSLIRGYADVLASGELGPLSPQQQRPLQVIVRRAHMLSNLVDDIIMILLAESRPMAWEPIDVGDLVCTIGQDFAVAIQQAGLTLEVAVEPDLPAVIGEGDYLYRVLDNLLGNALKFTPPGGTITVRAQREEQWLVLTVSDTGIGIPAEDQERCFERFYQVDGSTRRRYGGAGLGLALVKEIVNAHHGEVYLESVVDQGSTFTIKLPVGEQVPPSEA
ncbi:MAG: GAF domain-containing protein [Anaerolineae bacterium]|nr:GAF domain-containing protein [Anaerolineae bacterium]